MATHNDEALDLKRRARRRLIGAIALVLFLVIVPPWIMDLEPQPVTTSLEVEIPKPEEQPLASLPSPAAPPTEEALTPAVPPAASEPPPPPTPSEPAPAPQPPPAKQTTSQPPKAPAAPAKKTAAAKESYIVPVATLANKSNVQQLQARIKDAGIKTYTEAVNTASGTQTRVRAGPFPTRAEAEKARKQLQGMGLKPGNVATR